MSEKILRVAIIGPESSGKSELSRLLAAHYQTQWIPEFARMYLSQLDHPYTLEDIVKIYKTQFQQEQELKSIANNYIFVDTEFIIAKVWCENAFKTCPAYIDEMIESHPYDLYLLTSPDLPWEYDPLRENPGKGEFFFNWYQTLLEKNKLNYGVVSGIGDVRLSSAMDAMEKQLINPEKFRLR